MFVFIKNITAFMDDNINFVKDAIENHSNVTEEEYKNYLIDMECKLNLQLNKLKEKSNNKKLIAKYEKIVKELFK